MTFSPDFSIRFCWIIAASIIVLLMQANVLWRGGEVLGAVWVQTGRCHHYSVSSHQSISEAWVLTGITGRLLTWADREALWPVWRSPCFASIVVGRGSPHHDHLLRADGLSTVSIKLMYVFDVIGQDGVSLTRSLTSSGSLHKTAHAPHFIFFRTASSFHTLLSTF